jgi:hypothetical protein
MSSYSDGKHWPDEIVGLSQVREKAVPPFADVHFTVKVINDLGRIKWQIDLAIVD